MGKKYTKDDFLQKAREVHGNKYDYSKTDLKNRDEKGRIEIVCPKHGEFWQRLNNHLMGYGCPICADEKNRMSTEEFLKRVTKVHGDNYDYSKTDLKHRDEKGRIEIICPKHGEFWQLPYIHLRGCGCRKCFEEKEMFTTNKIIEKANIIHKNKYVYTKSRYNGYFQKMIITCPIHGDFEQTPDCHLHGCGCPKCNSSKLEEEMRKFLLEKGIEFEEQKRFDWLGRQSLDFYLPKYNIGIECQGEQHFKAIENWGGNDKLTQTKLRDNKKQELCEKNGIKLLYFSNLNISYPYKVFEDKEKILKEIKNGKL